jgi:type VI protein secretion system component Hcp
MVIASNHEIMSSVGNTGSGAAAGKRVHKPFVITKEDLTVWELKFYSAAVTGVDNQNYTVKLNPYEEIEFTYQTIQWTWVDGNITTTDQWQS